MDRYSIMFVSFCACIELIGTLTPYLISSCCFRMALCVLIYLAIHRVDLAERQLKAMQDQDDEDCLTQV